MAININTVRINVPSEIQQVRELFALEFRNALARRYGRIPSSAFVAREFNIRAYGCEPVTHESARRWLRGLSLPNGERLRILKTWLEMDLNFLFTHSGLQQQQVLNPDRQTVAFSAQPTANGICNANQLATADFGADSELLSALLLNLSPDQKSTLLTLALRLAAQNNRPQTA